MTQPWMTYARKAWAVVAYTYEADIHCPACTVARFGPEPRDGYTVTDSEGNTPKPIFASDQDETLTCGDCGRDME